MDIIETDFVISSIKMISSVMSNQSNRIGQIVGPPGTGKTFTSLYLAERFQGIRVRAFSGISRRDLVNMIARALKFEGRLGTPYGSLMEWLMRNAKNKLILVDEANHLNWRQLEPLRDLSDETGAGIILIGTQLMERQFEDGRTSIFLAQMTSRIGGKRVHFKPFFRDEEVGAFFVQPVFGQKAMNKKLLTAFRIACHGNWREASELTHTCLRIMREQGFEKLTQDIIHTAATFMAITEEIKP